MPRTLDVHHHLAPPPQIAAIGAASLAMPAPSLNWTVDRSLRAMDEAGLDAAILSIAPPGLGLQSAASPALARACNEYAAGLKDDASGRFGFFAGLPLTDTSASIEEANYALDHLGAAGVLLFTNVEGRYLGHPTFAPLLDHLNTRSAVAFVHPIGNACCANLVPGVAEPVVEYGTETARTIASLLASSDHRLRLDLKMIFSHAGGTAPALTQRFVIAAEQRGELDPERYVFQQLGRFYYDTAQAGNRINIMALRQITAIDHVMFGSDYPFLDIKRQVDALERVGLTDDERLALLSLNPVLFSDGQNGPAPAMSAHRKPA